MISGTSHPAMLRNGHLLVRSARLHRRSVFSSRPQAPIDPDRRPAPPVCPDARPVLVLMTAELFPAPASASRTGADRPSSLSRLPGLKAVFSAAPAGNLLSRGPRGLVGLLLSQGARARRVAQPRAFVTLTCHTPVGSTAVTITLP